MENTTQIPQSNIEVLKADVCKMRPNVGDNEFALAFQKALANDNGDPQRLVAFILHEIDAHRKPFIGDYTYAGTDTWKKAYAASEKAAERLLLSASPQLAELDSLEAAAVAAKNAADKKTAELNRLFADFQALPGQMERLRSRMTRLTLERAALDLASLKAKAEDQYRQFLFTESVLRRTDADYYCAVLAQRELKLGVIDAVESETKSEVAALQQKNIQLSKALGIKRHNLN